LLLLGFSAEVLTSVLADHLKHLFRIACGLKLGATHQGFEWGAGKRTMENAESRAGF
jgi:hypothetical protein